ncbi:NAD(P)/FAD-dependent oxidoreductase [Halodesulfovibrio spirochaetisodalis]|uniref:NADH:ubiquinone reductase (non-electrogenic) n=1 Tax=Halodesulfovibrio spirochaetisodalis TaxID=1560234 RepID=A0A1B7XE63_9BACT|nr:NAD(P)/FAD-dependent oxidoreductase [Halodesulfovibrio spirochaetisodalis]OBQ52427.1 pyridine nucleotide-disulfide oxidoreductase [Halodesulfovibrio spirochaetisodalis]
MSKHNSNTKQIIVLGGGFAGLWAAKEFSKKDGYQITVIDRNNYHLFQPLLYQVASAGLEPEQISYPLRGTFRKMPNVKFRMAEITGLDLDNKTLHSDVGPIQYDGLIIALGSVTSYFGVPGASEFAFSLKNAEEAIDIRNHILSCFEYAQYEPDPKVREELLTFVIVGGGPTGVEYVGALSELVNNSLHRDFKGLHHEDVRIMLVEGEDGPLNGYPEKLRNYANKRLENLNVRGLYKQHVVQVEADKVTLKNGDEISTRTVLWTAGIRGNRVAENMGVPLGHANRIITTPTLQLEDHPEVFVAGDIALPMDGDKPVTGPTVAPNAIQQGALAAKNLQDHFEGKELKPFIYFDKGSLATIGRSSAVVHLGKFQFTGFFAWITWLVVHLLYLIGFRNRTIVFINWAFEYFLFERGVRLIMPKAKDTIPHGKADEYSTEGTEGTALNKRSVKEE